MTIPAPEGLRKTLARATCFLLSIVCGGIAGLTAIFNGLGAPPADPRTLLWINAGLYACLSVSLLFHALGRWRIG